MTDGMYACPLVADDALLLATALRLSRCFSLARRPNKRTARTTKKVERQSMVRIPVADVQEESWNSGVWYGTDVSRRISMSMTMVNKHLETVVGDQCR